MALKSFLCVCSSGAVVKKWKVVGWRTTLLSLSSNGMWQNISAKTEFACTPGIKRSHN